MRLTDATARNAQARDKAYRLTDGRGMYLEVSPAGGKYWRMKYRFAGREKRLAIGVYPEVSLKEARDRRDNARKMLANNVDPTQHRKSVKASNVEACANSFEVIAREWFLKNKVKWVEGHSDKIIRRLQLYVFPWIGTRPISQITARELLGTLQRLEEGGKNETARRALNACTRVFTYAIVTDRAQSNPAASLKGALGPTSPRHMATITEPEKVGALLRAIDGYQGATVTRLALRLAPLVFVRPGELRKAEWSEIDWERQEWRIPAARMKMRQMHVVPLSTQAMGWLQELNALTKHGRYVFPGIRDRTRPMSENTVNAALRRLGYEKTEMTGHGFRAMASTLLNEQRWHRDAIERQLAHGERNAVRAAYDHAEHMPQRREMMQKWADYLDTLRIPRQSISNLVENGLTMTSVSVQS